MTRKNGYTPELTPDYIDEVNGGRAVNKVTLAPGDPERELTLLLKPHVGKAGREKDARLMEYFVGMQSELETEKNEMKVFLKNKETLVQMALLALDLDTDEGQGIVDNLTFFEIVDGFQKGMRYRSGDMHREVVEAAVKKYKGEREEENLPA